MLLFNFYASMQICAFDKLGEKVGLELLWEGKLDWVGSYYA